MQSLFLLKVTPGWPFGHIFGLFISVTPESRDSRRYIFPAPPRRHVTVPAGSPGKKRAIMAESTQQNEVEAQAQVEEKGEEKKEHLELQPEQETMRSVVLTGYGGINKMQVQKYAKPKPMNGQVVVRVHAWWVELLPLKTAVLNCFCFQYRIEKSALVSPWNAYVFIQQSKKLFQFVGLKTVGGAVMTRIPRFDRITSKLILLILVWINSCTCMQYTIQTDFKTLKLLKVLIFVQFWVVLFQPQWNYRYSYCEINSFIIKIIWSLSRSFCLARSRNWSSWVCCICLLS